MGETIFIIIQVNLIDINCINQSVDIDDTLCLAYQFILILPISSINIRRYICSSVHPNAITDFMQTVNLLTIELQLRVEVSNN